MSHAFTIEQQVIPNELRVRLDVILIPALLASLAFELLRGFCAFPYDALLRFRQHPFDDACICALPRLKPLAVCGFVEFLDLGDPFGVHL